MFYGEKKEGFWCKNTQKESFFDTYLARYKK